MFFIARSEVELLKGFGLTRKSFKTKPSYIDLQLHFTDERKKAFSYEDKETENQELD